MLSCNFKEERSKTFSLRNLVDSYYLWIWKTNVSLSLIFHIFITKFHSSSCSLVDHQFGLLRPSCPLQLWTKSKPDKHAVIVTQAALGGTLTFLELEAAEYCTGGECVQCLCVCVCVSVRPLGVEAVCLHGWISHDKCGQNIISIWECANQKKKAASSTLLLFFLYKHVLPINQNTVCVCFLFHCTLLQCH